MYFKNNKILTPFVNLTFIFYKFAECALIDQWKKVFVR